MSWGGTEDTCLELANEENGKLVCCGRCYLQKPKICTITTKSILIPVLLSTVNTSPRRQGLACKSLFEKIKQTNKQTKSFYSYLMSISYTGPSTNRYILFGPKWNRRLKVDLPGSAMCIDLSFMQWDGALVKGAIPGPGVICGLSCCWFLSFL